MKPVAALVATALLVTVALAAEAQRVFDHDILRETFGFDDSTLKSVALDDLRQGCSARDCIPSIDAPKYVPADAANHVNDDDRVIAINRNGDKRAYPTRILDRHEIVNDTIGADPIAITWCPLCGSAVGIRRVVGGEVSEFGVSGVLYNSDLVLYDRTTETLWDQIEASGIVGPQTGDKLELVPVTLTTWARWKAAHPDTLVLSSDTGFDFDYSSDRYAKYRETVDLMFPVSRADDRVHPKSVVFGFDIDGVKVAYTEALLNEHGTYTHNIDGVEVAVTLQDDGMVTLSRDDNTYEPIRLFWFAWYTFHPDTELID